MPKASRCFDCKTDILCNRTFMARESCVYKVRARVRGRGGGAERGHAGVAGTRQARSNAASRAPGWWGDQVSARAKRRGCGRAKEKVKSVGAEGANLCLGDITHDPTDLQLTLAQLRQYLWMLCLLRGKALARFL